MNKKLFFVSLACFAFNFGIYAQPLIKGFEFGEIINISQTYQQAPSLSFSMVISYADSTSQDSIIDQVSASYKIQYGRYWAMVDSTEMVQGSGYNVSILHNDSIIIISNMQKTVGMMQLPLMDSLFRAQNVSSMKISQINDSTRSLRMYFNPSSYYSGYIFNYDVHTYLINSIIYFIKTPANEDDSGSGTSMVKVVFSNYSTKPIDNSFFQTDKFIYKQGDQFLAQPPYSKFQLMVNVSK